MPPGAVPPVKVRASFLLTILTVAAARTAAAQDPADTDTTRHAKGGSQFLIPLGSMVVPGLGQYLHGATLPGLAFTGTALGGYALYSEHETDVDLSDLPRDGDRQLGYAGLFLVSGASFVSASDAFSRAIPDLQREGKYGFLTNRKTTASLFTAPFDPQFLGRWTTWIHLAYTGAVAAIVLGDRAPGVSYEPYRARDAAFATGLSLSAGIGEEAVFRGWLFPLFHQSFGQRFWLSNGLQSVLFGGGHADTQGAFALITTGWAFYEGWLTQRNGWNIRESIFHHFWYDVVIVSAEFLTDARVPVAITFPTIRF